MNIISNYSKDQVSFKKILWETARTLNNLANNNSNPSRFVSLNLLKTHWPSWLFIFLVHRKNPIFHDPYICIKFDSPNKMGGQNQLNHPPHNCSTSTPTQILNNQGPLFSLLNFQRHGHPGHPDDGNCGHYRMMLKAHSWRHGSDARPLKVLETL